MWPVSGGTLHDIHRTLKSTFGLLLLLLGVCAGGCVRNANPILNDDQVVSNDALLGKWVSQDGKITVELKPGEDNGYKLTCTDEDGKTGAFIVRFGKLNDTMVAEVKADACTTQNSAEFRSLLLPLYAMIVIEKTSPQLVVSAPRPTG